MRTTQVRRVLANVLVLNALVVLVKVAIGFRTNALTVLGAALESGLDTLNNVIGMIMVSVASRAPDENHPYGHEKFESLGALGIVGFLSISCFELLQQGVISLIGGTHVARAGRIDILVMLGTLVVNGMVVAYERRKGRELGSAFLLADAEHTSSDVLVTLLALASLGLSRIGFERVDPVLAIVVALIIAWSGYRVLLQSVPILVDERAVQASELRRVVSDIPEILEVRSVRSRSTASRQLFVEMTVVVSGSMSVEHAHALADRVESVIGEHFGAAQVTVHVEPP
jgi:cation diffusion facilitator family transporter